MSERHYCPQCQRSTWWNPTWGEMACSICHYWHPDTPIYPRNER